MATGSVTADAEVYPHHIRADAWILGERQRHHRLRDHTGAESDLYVVLSQDVGPYVAYTPIHYVLEDLVNRVLALESAQRMRSSFTADADVVANGAAGYGYFFLDAVMGSSATGSLTADAIAVRGGTFTADAYIPGSIIADAFIV